MAYQHKPNSGSLWKNLKREKDTHPEYKGSAMIDGVEYWVSAWVNTSQQDGSKYFGMKYERKDAQQAQAPQQAAQDFQAPADMDPDIPF